MSKKLLGASIVALLFSSVCFANGLGTDEAAPVVPAEMRSMIIDFCDGNHEGDVALPTDAN